MGVVTRVPLAEAELKAGSAVRTTVANNISRSAQPATPPINGAETPADNGALTEQSVSPSNPSEPVKKDARGTAKKAARLILLVTAAGLGYHVASDRMAPSSSTGQVAAAIAQIAPRVPGQVETIFVEDNKDVSAGQKLFALDTRPYDLAVRSAEVSLEQARQAVAAAASSLQATQAQVDQAHNSLLASQTSFDRTLELHNRGVTTQASLDTARTQLETARASLAIAEANSQSAQQSAGGDGDANVKVLAAQVQLDQALLNREFAVVTAPTDGYVTNLKLSAGQYLNAGSPALTFISSQRPWVMADFRENQLAHVKPGQEVSLAFDGQPGQLFKGTVQGIAWGIDPGRTTANGLPQNQSSTRWFEPARSIPVRIEILDDAAPNVRVGSKVNAMISATGDNPVVWLATSMQRVGAFFSYLY
jgi:multidrug resistance efflux pump